MDGICFRLTMSSYQLIDAQEREWGGWRGSGHVPEPAGQNRMHQFDKPPDRNGLTQKDDHATFVWVILINLCANDQSRHRGQAALQLADKIRTAHSGARTSQNDQIQMGCDLAIFDKTKSFHDIRHAPHLMKPAFQSRRVNQRLEGIVVYK